MKTDATKSRTMNSPRSTDGSTIVTRESASILLALMCIAAAGRLQAGEVRIQWPSETASFKPAPGADAANAHCLACHSVEYVETQPPFPRTFWVAEVKKMQAKFGAQVPAEQIEPLADYLAKQYGTATDSSAGAESTAAAGANTPPVSVEQLATTYGCLSCHKVDAKLVGPAFKEIAAKYRDDAAALDKICRQIREGGSGKWGSVVMPPFKGIGDAQARRLAEWIMSRKGAGQ